MNSTTIRKESATAELWSKIDTTHTQQLIERMCMECDCSSFKAARWCHIVLAFVNIESWSWWRRGNEWRCRDTITSKLSFSLIYRPFYYGVYGTMSRAMSTSVIDIVPSLLCCFVVRQNVVSCARAFLITKMWFYNIDHIAKLSFALSQSFAFPAYQYEQQRKKVSQLFILCVFFD